MERNGTADLVEAYFDPALARVVPERQLDVMTRGLPRLRERFPTHRAYAEASVEELLGESLARTRFLEATWLIRQSSQRAASLQLAGVPPGRALELSIHWRRLS